MAKHTYNMLYAFIVHWTKINSSKTRKQDMKHFPALTFNVNNKQ